VTQPVNEDRQLFTPYVMPGKNIMMMSSSTASLKIWEGPKRFRGSKCLILGK